MKVTKKAQKLLEKIAQIPKMERGKICKMSGRCQFNHQTWQNGRNIVRYVQTEEIYELQDAIDGYALFTKLTEQYAEEMIRLTRSDHQKRLDKSENRPKI